MRHVWTVLKIVLAVGILAYVVWQVRQSNANLVAQLWEQEKNWWSLLGAFLVTLAGVAVTFVRWHMLVVAVGIPFTLSDAFRLGSIGYLFNFIGVGSVGGDVFKAAFLAHEHPGRKTEAIATVVLDRLMGLYGLFVVGAVAALFMNLDHSPVLGSLARAAQIGAVIATLMLGALFVPGFLEGAWWTWAAQLPWIGPNVASLRDAARAYRDQPLVIGIAVLMSFVTHLLNSLSIFLSAQAILPDPPSLFQHFLIGPFSVFAASVPLAPGGLGTFEFALQYLYKVFANTNLGKDAGLAVALVFRMLTLGVAALGFGYYLTCREEVAEVLQEAVEESEDKPPPDLAQEGRKESGEAGER